MFGIDFRFENSQVFIYLWLLPVLGALLIVVSRWGQKKLKKSIGAKALPNLVSSVDPRRRRWKLLLQLAVLMMMIVALARPQMGESKQEIRSEGVEIMLMIDVSESMLAEDVRPNRLEQAKTELAKLSEMLTGSKIGIVAFAGSAALLSPLTSDPASLRMYLDSLSINSVSTQGTAFQPALEEAEAGFERGGVATDETTKVTRVVIIASDGEDHEPGALEQAQKLAAKGIRLYSLIYGTEKGAPIPERDGMGYLRGYKKDRSGQTVLTTVKGDALRALAEAGKGLAVHASFGGTHLKTIVEQINQLEKTQFESTMATQYDERYQLFAALAFVLMLIELMLGDRRQKNAIWQGRFHGGQTPPLIFILSLAMISLLSPRLSAQVDPLTYLNNESAIRALQKAQAMQANEMFLNLLGNDPLDSRLHFNLGLSFEILQQAEKAKASYLVAIENSRDPQTLFQAYFNLGLLEQKAKNKDIALQFYQKALAINPDSWETKINIELLTQQSSQQQKGDGDQQQQQQDEPSKGDSENQSEQGQEQKDNEKQQPPKESDQPKQYQKPKPQPQEFKSQELSEGDVKKILGEIKQQEQKIRAEFNKKEVKETAKDKDW